MCGGWGSHGRGPRRLERAAQGGMRACSAGTSAVFQQLDPVAVGVADEAQARAAVAHRVRRALVLDALFGELSERLVEVAGGDRDMAVAGAELIWLVVSNVVGQLESRLGPVLGESHEDIYGLIPDRQPPHLLKSKGPVELDRAVDIRDPVAGVN